MWVLPIISILAGFFSLTELGRPDANSLWAVAVALFFMLAGMPIRLRPTHTSYRTYAIYPVVSHKAKCHISGVGGWSAE